MSSSHSSSSLALVLFPALQFSPENCVQLFEDPMVHQGPLSMGFSRQVYWSRLPVHSPGDLPNPGIVPRSPTLQADSLPSDPSRKPLGSPYEWP